MEAEQKFRAKPPGLLTLLVSSPGASGVPARELHPGASVCAPELAFASWPLRAYSWICCPQLCSTRAKPGHTAQVFATQGGHTETQAMDSRDAFPTVLSLSLRNSDGLSPDKEAKHSSEFEVPECSLIHPPVVVAQPLSPLTWDGFQKRSCPIRARLKEEKTPLIH